MTKNEAAKLVFAVAAEQNHVPVEDVRLTMHIRGAGFAARCPVGKQFFSDLPQMSVEHFLSRIQGCHLFEGDPEPAVARLVGDSDVDPFA